MAARSSAPRRGRRRRGPTPGDLRPGRRPGPGRGRRRAGQRGQLLVGLLHQVAQGADGPRGPTRPRVTAGRPFAVAAPVGPPRPAPGARAWCDAGRADRRSSSQPRTRRAGARAVATPSITITSATVRSRKARSWLTTTRAPGQSSRKSSSARSVSRSRSLVGLVEQQHVRAGPPGSAQLEAAALAARQQPDRAPTGHRRRTRTARGARRRTSRGRGCSATASRTRSVGIEVAPSWS